MFPNRAPFGGPGSTFNINQDRQGLHASLLGLMAGINATGTVLDPDQTTLILPGLSSSLNLGLPGGQLYLGNGVGTVAACSTTLDPYRDNYLEVVISGTGDPRDFSSTDLTYQASGTYTNQYAVNTGSLKASAPVDISSGVTFSQTYLVLFNGSGGWGPALLDQQGNGYVVRLSAGGGGFYRAVNGVATGAAVQLIGYTNLAGGANHKFQLKVTYNSFGAFVLSLSVDTMNKPIASYTDTTPVISPLAVYPAFLSDGGAIFMTNWNWSNADQSPVLSWRKTSLPTGADFKGAGRLCFRVTTAATPIEIVPYLDNSRLSHRIITARETINQLTKAYL